MKYLVYVKCCFNGEYREVPIRDYMEIMSHNHGFDSYKDLRKQGYIIRLSKDDVVVRACKL